MTVIVSALVSIKALACVDAVTIGETISCGCASLTGGSKEKSSVVYCGGTKSASTFDENCKDSVETLKNAIDLSDTWLAKRTDEASYSLSVGVVVLGMVGEVAFVVLAVLVVIEEVA